MDRIKKLLASPKRTAMTLLCITAALAVLVFVGGIGLYAWARVNAISPADAEKIAAAYAGVDASLIQDKRTDFEFENGRFVYEIKLTAEGVQYDCRIGARDGTVLSRETNGRKTAAKVSSGNPALSRDEAKARALQDARVPAEGVAFTKEEVDDEDGVPLLKLRFHTADTAYRYEINLETGEIKSKKEEYYDASKERQTAPIVSQAPSNGTDTQNQGAGYIGMERAKEIAAAHAGIPVSDAMFSKVKTDREHGRSVYEVEFYAQGMEYEYDIDALSGDILKFEKEYDHD